MLPPGLQGLTEMEVEKLLIDLDEFTPTVLSNDGFFFLVKTAPRKRRQPFPFGLC